MTQYLDAINRLTAHNTGLLRGISPADHHDRRLIPVHYKELKEATRLIQRLRGWELMAQEMRLLDPEEYLRVYTLTKVQANGGEPYVPYELESECKKLWLEEGLLEHDGTGYSLSPKGEDFLVKYK